VDVEPQPHATPARVDPRITRSRVRIVEAATTHFLERGYLAANVDEIAAQAGVAKRTIYNIFGGKEELFRAVLAEVVATAERFAREVVGPVGTGDDVAGELRDVGTRLAQVVVAGGRIVALRRLLIGEVGRFPALAADYYERAPGRVMAALADALERYAERGLLDVDDPSLAAEHLAFLVMGASLDRALFAPADAPPDPDLVEARAIAGVEVFLRAYAPSDDRIERRSHGG
jgi:TetR/AcrR family transcriptional regulator, mexJK operon transcriptional repressor